MIGKRYYLKLVNLELWEKFYIEVLIDGIWLENCGMVEGRGEGFFYIFIIFC